MNINVLISLSLLFFILIPSHAKALSKIQKFQQSIAKELQEKPLWWNEVEENSTSLKTYKDIIEVRKSIKQCCDQNIVAKDNRSFVKALYLDLLTNEEKDIHFFANAILNLTLKYTAFPGALKIQYEFLNSFRGYKKPIDNCHNCKSGDLSAKLFLSLLGSSLASNEQNRRKLIELSLQFLKNRNDIFNYYKITLVERMIKVLLDNKEFNTFNFVLDEPYIDNIIKELAGKKFRRNTLVRQKLKTINKHIAKYNRFVFEIHREKAFWRSIGVLGILFLALVFWIRKKNILSYILL